MQLRVVVLALLLLTSAGVIVAFRSQAEALRAGAPFALDHVFIVIEENHEYDQIIGNPAAPHINTLAQQYGLATSYFAVTSPSEGNYVAMLGGESYGIEDDGPYTAHTIDQLNIVDQLERAGLRWGGFFQSMPVPAFTQPCAPTPCGGDAGSLYASRHNGFLNFSDINNNPERLQHLVPITDLDLDLAAGSIPNFSVIVPDNCHNMHGDPPHCPDRGKPGSDADNQLIAEGDAYLGDLIGRVTKATFWNQGNNAIIVVWDEGTTSASCCATPRGGGHLPAIVATSHGPRGLKDPTHYNHYSLLRTVQLAFGLPCLEMSCDFEHVKPMLPLFSASTG